MGSLFSTPVRYNVLLADMDGASDVVLAFLDLLDTTSVISGPAGPEPRFGRWTWEHFELHRVSPLACEGEVGNARVELAYGDMDPPCPPRFDLVIVLFSPSSLDEQRIRFFESVSAFLKRFDHPSHVPVWLVMCDIMEADLTPDRLAWSRSCPDFPRVTRTFPLYADKEFLCVQLNSFPNEEECSSPEETSSHSSTSSSDSSS